MQFSRRLLLGASLTLPATLARPGLIRAQGAGIPTTVLDHKAFDGREAFDAALMQARTDDISRLIQQ